MHQHTQLHSFEDPQKVSIEVQQRLEAKLNALVKPTFLEVTTLVHSH
jgi:hypothetical protein